MPLEREKKYFNEIRDSLLAAYPDQVAVVHGEELIGVYPTLEEAYAEAVKKLGLVSVLIKKIGEQDEPVSIPALALGVLSANDSHPVRR
jgi:asparagine synthetase A